jgi:hypothetical protein
MPKRFIADGEMFKRVEVEPGRPCGKQVDLAGNVFACAFSTDAVAKHTRICQACKTTYCGHNTAFKTETNQFLKAITWMFVPNVTCQVDQYYDYPLK